MAIITNYLLFNHTYLRKLQADDSVDEQASFVAQGVRDWYGFRDNVSIESLVSSWIQPVLNSLELDLQPTGNDHIQLLYRLSDWGEPVGLCYIAPPGADLDTTTKGHHWMAQAVLAARDRELAPESGAEGEAEEGERQALRWVILTNGNQWRLLDAQVLRRYEAYLEVDLEELVQDPSDLSAMRVFYRCFHRGAFERDAEGRSGLSRLLDESNHATKAGEDHLKDCVSANEGVMAQLCLGLVEATGKDHFSEDERDDIYGDATYLLYRMLFILYAEARGLLPMDNPSYEQASLHALVVTTYAYKLRGIPNAHATTLWLRLKRLCNAIYESDPELGIPAYNGGLFDDGDKPHLRAGTITDGHLTQTLFELAYQPDGDAEDGYRRLDYRDLSVRHLGSIYEGMIEYKLQIAEETLWARRDGKGNIRFLHTGQDGAPRRNDDQIKKGDVYFSQSPGERRTTGTYYTPEFIVEYIVQQTVGSGLRERRAPLEEKIASWLEEIAATTDSSQQAQMQRTADQELLRFVEEQVLTFRVCDPAMGSGHFLVNAATQITNFVVQTLHLTPWANETVNADPAVWRRRLVQRCLYGVDLSLMAVELAKLSLWLGSVAEGKPLSFLDHHLRQGNSLIGTRLEDLAEVLVETVPARPSPREREALEAGQLTMLDHPAFRQHVTEATDLLIQISARAALTLEDVKAQETDYEKVRVEIRPYLKLADLWTAQHLGLGAAKHQLRAVSKYLINEASGPNPECKDLLARTQEMACKQHFFHWDLEFPEVFLDSEHRTWKELRGFDAVLGNPPYVATGTLRSTDMEAWRYYRKHYASASSGKFDIYLPFLERGWELTGRNGRTGYILPNKWLKSDAGTELRRLLVEETAVEMIADFGANQVFPGITTYTCVCILSGCNKDRFRYAEVGLPPQKRRASWITVHYQNIDETAWNPNAIIWKQLDEKKFLSLEDAATIFVGTTTNADGVFILRGAQTESGTLHAFSSEENDFVELELDMCIPFLRGRDVSRYRIVDPSVVVLFPYHRGATSARLIDPGVLARQYPLAWAYLERHRDRLEARENGRWKGQGDWYCHAYPRNHRQIGESKLLSPDICDHGRWVLDSQGTYHCLNTVYGVSEAKCGYRLSFLLAILNSKAFQHFIRSHSVDLRGGYYRVTKNFMRGFPVPHIDFVAPINERDRLIAEGRNLYELCMLQGNGSRILAFVQHHLDPVVNHADVVHDLLAFLAEQMMDTQKKRQQLEREADLFRFLERSISCLRLNKALASALAAGEMVGDPSTVRHDIEGLRLSEEEEGHWLVEVKVKLRDPTSDWREYRRDSDGSFIREWLPVYRIPLDEDTGRFYHYAFAKLEGFNGAGKFPGGYTRTTLQKLEVTKVPKFVPVDLAPLAALEAELDEVRRKIGLTDGLIDQIVYSLYGLTEDEIAIVEGKS